MPTLAFIEGLGSPIHWIILLVMLGGLAAVLFVVVIVARSAVRSPDPRDADLDRRRRALELEKLELENRERRERLDRDSGHAAP